jgi:hypothetical protein
MVPTPSPGERWSIAIALRIAATAVLRCRTTSRPFGPRHFAAGRRAKHLHDFDDFAVVEQPSTSTHTHRDGVVREAAIIGWEARNIPVEHDWDHVAGAANRDWSGHSARRV